MEIKEIAKNVYACLQEDKGFGWNNSAFVTTGGGLVVDTLWDLPYTQRMIDLYGEVGPQPPRYLVNTHHNADHVWGNQLFADSEIIAHRLCKEGMENGITPTEFQALFADPIPVERQWFADDISVYDFSDIEITLPTRLIEDKLELQLDNTPCHIIYLGPAHTASDIIVHLPEESVVIAGDLIFNGCTPLGWEGTTEKWLEAIDFIISLKPKVIVPGHGPLCGIEVASNQRDYLEYVFEQTRPYFDQGIDPLEAAKKIDVSAYQNWTEPERLIWNVARAYREFRGGSWDEPYGDRVQLIHQGHQLRSYWNKAGMTSS
jgi:cyclase